ncbi:MAG: AraC family transcriptional regulator ligand-binding domain-containing protein [Polyangiaceae bacterium]
MRAKGVQVGPFLREAGLSHIDENAEALYLHPRDAAAAEKAAAKVLGDGCMGLHAALWRPTGGLGLVEFVARSASTLDAALSSLIRFQSLCFESLRIDREDRPQGTRVTNRAIGPSTSRHQSEFVVATELIFCRGIRGAHLVPRNVWFAHTAPDSAALSELVSFFGTTNIRFSSESDGFELPAEALASPMQSADLPLHDFLVKTAAHELTALAHRDTLPIFRSTMSNILNSQVPSAASVARALGTSTRSLHRMLAEHGTLFQTELDSLREELARRYLADKSLSVGDVSLRLRYRDQRSFLRAFRRWTGKSPRQFRAGARITDV